MRRFTQLTFFLTFGFAIALGFQNCAGYEAVNNPLFDAPEAVCIGLACGENAEYLGLSINSEALYVQKPVGAVPASCEDNDSRCVDIAGFCEDGGFPDHQIVAALSGNGGFAETLTPAKCIDGRYRVLIQLPSNYDFDSIHNLKLIIRGVASDGYVVNNPNNANTMEIGLIPYSIL